MANEAVIIELNNPNPIQFTCASGTKIAKGTLLQMTDPRTVSASSAAEVFAGVAAADKASDDQSTTIAVHVPNGSNVFDLKASADTAITAGQMVKLSGANLIGLAVDTDLEAGKVVGQALETAAANEVIAVRV